VDVVATYSVDVCAVAVLNASEVGERLQVAGLTALVGALVTEQASATVPVKELAGVTVIVDVLPVVAPGVTAMLLLLESVKLPLLGGVSQKPAHPDNNGAAARSIHAHFPIFIAAPLSSLSITALRVPLRAPVRVARCGPIADLKHTTGFILPTKTRAGLDSLRRADRESLPVSSIRTGP
jgi:hypothetical protein